ncbi:hypothetical protein PEBR_22517 [Penicillium brasilianum]|uniref:F-box domain-containing protein n=1 Tax=Penicillium brasilianum TaxID=104259 RepID=A0A1S9RL41_PENBI|nr:hypothetical protein PEBR_22517 [Penicillium brasilianum]
MALRFVDMPNEIIANILDYASRSSLSSLALVSRRFTSLIVPRLYKSVFYDPEHQSSEEIPHASTKIHSLDSLLNALEKNENLRSLIVDAKLIWGRLLCDRDANRGAITRLLGVMTHLRTLKIRPGDIYFTHARSDQISSLHMCIAQGRMVGMDVLEPLLTKKSLRNLSMTTIQNWAGLAKTTENAANAQNINFKSSISYLAVSSSICSASAMQAILHAPKALISLHYHYRGRQLQNDNAVTPANFPEPLLAQQSSLNELVIHAQPHQHISQQHPIGYVMKSMRSFVALKRLALPAWWMVHPSISNRERQITKTSCLVKLVERIPPNLEVLQIQLEEIRLHCRNQVQYDHISRNENVIARYDMLLSWLGEIAESKHLYAQALKEVIVWSSSPKLLHEDKMRQDSGIERVFLEQGIDIRFFICRPDSPVLFGVNTGV